MRARMTPPNIIVSIAMCFLLFAVVAAGCKMGAPAVVSTQPASGATAVPLSPAMIKITFDQPMVPSSVEKAFSIRPEVGTAKPTFAWSENDRVVVITFPRNLAPNTQYTVTLGTDAHATNAVALAAPQSFSFTTSQTAVAGEAAQPAPTEQPAAEQPAPAPAQGAEPGACPPPEEAPSAASMSFDKDIAPIAKSSCDGCHASAASGSMANYENIINKKYVMPKDPDNSLYYKKGSGLVTHGGSDAWKANKQLVRDWIQQGAPK
ncbi:MAG: Ig-like domain-containing protein [Armatimonadota bacterium]|nr:Ig-like domain-containing protein [Armatimonadota bacterium]